MKKNEEESFNMCVSYLNKSLFKLINELKIIYLIFLLLKKYIKNLWLYNFLNIIKDNIKNFK